MLKEGVSNLAALTSRDVHRYVSVRDQVQNVPTTLCHKQRFLPQQKPNRQYDVSRLEARRTEDVNEDKRMAMLNTGPEEGKGQLARGEWEKGEEC